jgi:hypothetical protein
MIDNPLTPLNMSSSPSTSNYESLGFYKSHSYTSSSASEKSGRAIRYRVRKPKVQKQSLTIDVREVELNLNGVKSVKSIYVVVGGRTEHKFISRESAENFITTNK